MDLAQLAHLSAYHLLSGAEVHPHRPRRARRLRLRWVFAPPTPSWRTRCVRNHADFCWMPSISPSFSDDMPLDDERMSHSRRSQIDTGRRLLSTGVPVRTENCRRQPPHRYRPPRSANLDVRLDPQRWQVISLRQRSSSAKDMASASVFVSLTISAKENLGFGMRSISAILEESESRVQ